MDSSMKMVGKGIPFRRGEEMKISKLTLAALGLATLTVFGLATDVQAANAPTDVTQNTATENGYKIAWSKVAAASDYTVTVVKDGKVVVAEASTGGKNEFSYVDQSKKVLTPGTSYKVQVRSVENGAKSSPAEANIATAPAVMTTFEQTGATTSSIKLSWNASAGATGYLVKMGKDAASAKDLSTITTTSINLTGLTADTAYYVAVYPVRKVTDKFYASEKCAFKTKAVTQADKVTGFKVADWNVKANYLRLSWTNSARYEAGYQVQFLTTAGKTIKTYNVYGRQANGIGVSNKKLKNKAMKARVRAYNTFNGEKVYGEWSNTLYLVPQANVTAKKVNATAIQLDWTKVTGAKKYQIMQATSDGGTYTKIATTKKNTYTVSGLKEGQEYYFYVKPVNAKMDGKNRSANKLSVQNDVVVQVYTSSSRVMIE